MSTSTLVTYATRHGSTQEVAEAVAAELRDCGLIVDLKAMQSVESMANYKAIVMGAPLYMFRWHKDSLNFLNKHKEGTHGEDPWLYLHWAHSTMMKKSGRTYASSWIMNWPNSPG